MSRTTQETQEYLRTPDGQAELTKLSKEGKTLEEIAESFGIVRQTLYVWSKKFPEIQSALSEGKRVADDRVEQSLYESCFGHMEKEIYVEKDGDGNILKQVMRTKYIPPNVTAIQYWLTNRRNDKWKARQQLELKGDSKLPIMFVNNVPNPYEQSQEKESEDDEEESYKED